MALHLGSMDGPRVPHNTEAVYRAVNRIFEGMDPPVSDYHAVVRYMNEELPRFEQADVSYLVLGSYRGEYGRRLREFANCLNMPMGAESIVLGDTLTVDTDVVPAFDVKIHLLGEATDYIAGVYETEGGGESPELGIVRALFVAKTFVFPRDYAGFTRDDISTREDVIHSALTVYYSDGSDGARREALLALLRIAEAENIDIDERELTDVIEQRIDSVDEPPATYSWVHLCLFKRFEAMGRCFPWTTMQGLRNRSDALPGPLRPRWETEFGPDDIIDD